jgi:RNA polymerase sigma-32 factor
VTSHLRLVAKIAMGYRGYGLPVAELIAEGNIGLLRAVEKFDLRGVRFKTYATYWIRAHMLAAAMRANSIVTVATGALGAKFFFKLRSARAKAETLLGAGHEGIDALLAEQFGVSEDVIRLHSARLGSHDVSLDVKRSEDSETTGLDLLPDESADPEMTLGDLERDELIHTTVRRLWKGLDARERADVARLEAIDNAEEASAERALAGREKERANAEAETAKRLLYVANMRALQAALTDGNRSGAHQLLVENKAFVPEGLPLELRCVAAELAKGREERLKVRVLSAPVAAERRCRS